MSTFLVTLGVGLAAILVVGIALSDPDQPATIRRPVDRAATAGPAPVTTVSPPAPPRPRRPRRRAGPLARLRSALALVVLVAFVGLMLAVLVGTVLALAARTLRHAVG